MPIRFRCPGCEGLLSIATRKAGTEIHCPKCDELLIVPPPVEGEASDDLGEPDPTPPPSSSRRLQVGAAKPKKKPPAVKDAPQFENPDFDRILGGLPDAPAKPAPAAAPPEPAPARAVAESGFLVGRATAALLAGLGLALVALAFAAGYLVGRG